MLKKIREILKNPKKKSLVQLGFYAIFFIFVFIFINIGGNSSNSVSSNVTLKEEEPIVNESINSYNFIINITELDTVKSLSGSYNNNEYNFIYDNVFYIYKDDKTYLDNNIVEDVFKIKDYSYSNINKLIEYSESETTYKESNKILYNINLEEYTISNPEGIYGFTSGNIELTIEQDNYINQVEINLDNQVLIQINYSNINNI